MLDVHPQHEAAHSWKDFFLHIATICIGLLIAIGLEQTVEAVHHRHQRHELEQQLRAETLRNLNIALVNIDDYTKAVDEANEQYTELMNAAHDHRVPQALRFPVPAAVVKPASAVWIVAQQSATLALLPPAISQRYVRVYSVADQATSCLLENNELSQKLSAALRPALTAAGLKTGITLSGASYDLSRMTADQLRIYSECLAEMISKEGYCRSRNKLLYGIEWSAWHGTTSDEENLRIALDASHTKGWKCRYRRKIPSARRGYAYNPARGRSVTMLDVHAPHEAAHSWKDFFLHIATIVIGLLIAVGLEQTVEYVHHRHQTREVRESLRHELAGDATMLQINRDALASTLQQLEKNQQMLDSGVPDPQVLSSLIYNGWNTHRPSDDAWTSAKANGSIALIPIAELRGVGYFYETVDGVNEMMLEYLRDMETAAAIVKHARSRSKLGEVEREKLTALNASASGRIALMSHLYVAQLGAFKIISLKQD